MQETSEGEFKRPYVCDDEAMPVVAIYEVTKARLERWTDATGRRRYRARAPIGVIVCPYCGGRYHQHGYGPGPRKAACWPPETRRGHNGHARVYRLVCAGPADEKALAWFFDYDGVRSKIMDAWHAMEGLAWQIEQEEEAARKLPPRSARFHLHRAAKLRNKRLDVAINALRGHGELGERLAIRSEGCRDPVKAERAALLELAASTGETNLAAAIEALLLRAM
jgi:hypothetical protein